jgi:hypothetical protein
VKALYKFVILTVAWMGLCDAWTFRWARFLIGDQKLYVATTLPSGTGRRLGNSRWPMKLWRQWRLGVRVAWDIIVELRLPDRRSWAWYGYRIAEWRCSQCLGINFYLHLVTFARKFEEYFGWKERRRVLQLVP